MKYFNNFFRKKRIGGFIKAYNLENWWNKSFNEEERDYIVKKYKPFGLGENTLIQGSFMNLNQPKSTFLTNLASWFSTKKDINIARKMIIEASKSFNEDIPILEKHFYYLELISHYYLDRENNDSFKLAIDACERQIAISKKVIPEFLKNFNKLPGHPGFEQLAILEEKRKRHKKALQLSEQALSEGWKGDWQKRINRLNLKIKK